jgi:hypothetical protein
MDPNFRRVNLSCRLAHEAWRSGKSNAGGQEIFSGIQFGMTERVKSEYCWKNNSALQVARAGMSSVQEIEAVLRKLSRAEIEEVRAWIDAFLEDQLELADEVKAKLDPSRREIEIPMEGLVADTWEKLGPASEIDYAKL